MTDKDYDSASRLSPEDKMMFFAPTKSPQYGPIEKKFKESNDRPQTKGSQTTLAPNALRKLEFPKPFRI
eukprot:CAMPEP_0194366456 /NCGR_PEP_ID=MMETSP0174-20130528/14496_1 /TAXON_ID=216777 /ORGANISM="Proboscia alata, Strain PI-D3" /LENGTH=68 /DNA_ID=CAMNT_0039141651 /DNA_START=86 /DNA_END=292 /DNA_ORIENTATION=-